MRIVNVVQRYAPAIGGAETWCQEVCRQFVKLGHEVWVLTLDITEEEQFWRDSPPERRKIALGPLDVDAGVWVRRFKRSIPVYSVYHGLYRSILDRLMKVYFYGPHSLEMYLKLAVHLRRADVVLLHTVPYPHNPVAWLAAKVLRKPTFMVPFFHPGHRFYERWHHYGLMKRCQGVFVLSEFEKEALREKGIDPARIVVTGAGVHDEKYRLPDAEQSARSVRERYGLSADTKLVLFVGRKIEEKGVAHLVEACEKLSAERKVALLLVGPHSEWFQDWYPRFAKTGPRARVIDLGQVPEPEKVALLNAADVLALPSRFESFGIVFLEAWAAGTPVIGTDAGAVPSVLGEGGLAVPYGDSAALAAALERVLGGPALSQRLVEAGRARIRTHYRWDRIAERTVASVAALAKPKLRLLYVSNLFPPYFVGGAEIIAARHARALARRGHEVRVFAGRLAPYSPRYSRSRERRDSLRIDRVRLHPGDISSEERNHDRPEIAVLFHELLRKVRPDVVHAHNLAGLGVGVVERCREAGIPVVMTLHDYWGVCFKNTMVKNDGRICMRNGPDCRQCISHVGSDFRLPIEQRNHEVRDALRHVSQFISPSEYLAQRYRENGLESARLGVLSYGIDLDRFSGSRRRSHAECVIGYNGYVGRHKGIGVLLEAMQRVKGARLVLCGPCEDPDFYRQRIRELELEGRVELRRPIPNHKIPRVLSRVDLAVLPSLWADNHPVSILEAMAAGLPVVASRVGGIPEIVRDGETGFLVEPGDPIVLAERLEQLVIDASLRASMGLVARQVAESEYAEERTIDALELVYRDAMAFPLGVRLTG